MIFSGNRGQTLSRVKPRNIDYYYPTTLAFAMFADLPKQKVGKHVPKYLLLGIKTKLFGMFGGFFSLRQKSDPSDLILFRIKGSCGRNLNTLQAVVVVAVAVAVAVVVVVVVVVV